MKRTAFSLLTAFWLSITPAPATTEVPLRIEQRHVLVDQVYIDGAGPFRFVLDTGAQSSSLRTDVARRLGLKAAYRVESDSIGGLRYLPAGVADQVTLGNHSATRVEMVIHDLDGVRLIDPHIQGVLGQNFLSQFDYLLDMRGRRLSFEDGLDGERLPFSLTSDRMTLRAGDLALVLDSGSGDLILFRDRGGLRETGQTMHADAVDVRIARLPELRVGKRTLKNIQTAVVPNASGGADGLLPLILFDSVYVNNTRGYVVLR